MRILLIIVIIYYGLRLIAKYILPIIWRNFIQNAQKDMQDKMKDIYSQQQKKEEGDVTIDYVSKQGKKKNNNQDGEYIDYEEVK